MPHTYRNSDHELKTIPTPRGKPTDRPLRTKGHTAGERASKERPVPHLIRRRPIFPGLLGFAHDVQEGHPGDQSGHPPRQHFEQQPVHVLRPDLDGCGRVQKGQGNKTLRTGGTGRQKFTPARKRRHSSSSQQKLSLVAVLQGHTSRAHSLTTR